MAYYLMLTKLTDKGRRTLKENPDRVLEVNKEVEKMAPNTKVISQYWLLGPYDFATILEVPDNWHMSDIAMDIGSRGTVETLTMPAQRTEDFVSFIKGNARYHGKS